MHNPLLGQIFVQAPSFEVGKSSYHFDTIDSSYIRFDKWSGNTYPAQKNFTLTKFDIANRMFIGLIDWTVSGGLKGEMYWLYFIVFNEDYSAIESGHVLRDGEVSNSFSEDLRYVNLSNVEEEEEEEEEDFQETDNTALRTESRVHAPTAIPFRNIERDQLFDAIIKINSIDNVGDFVGGFFSNSENSNSKIRKRFQSYVARSVTSFRKEVVEGQALGQFKNDLSTIEICGAVMAIALRQMRDRGVDGKIANRIIFEGIRATFALKSSAQDEPLGKSIITIIESYISEDIHGTDEQFFNIVFRLIGSNVGGKLQPDYSATLQDYAHAFQKFAPNLDPGFTRFVEKTISESNFLVDNILDVRW